MRAEIKNLSKSQLKGRWGSAILAFLVISSMGLVVNLVGEFIPIPMVSMLVMGATLFLGGVITFGLSRFTLNFIDGRNEFTDIFSGFEYILKATGLYAIQGIITIILIYIPMIIIIMFVAVTGSVGLIIPMILIGVLGISILVLAVNSIFSQSFFIFTEDPNKGIIECIKESRELMKGRVGEYILLNLSFLGWGILVGFTFGLGGIFLIPYTNITYGNYYRRIRDEKESVENFI
ncbi:DUF975 family protein [uncultured Clostridium sp.]|jgi:uncharacterized membrane protein|uniref:DUF975 family protein n=1 Tax=uncultured Clostridium sp. TaxID=59620 RepID=UPI002636D528|nr:DUF975 family protein [uncultured Clostridium sp.]